jgi:hypothetical protein
VREADSSAGKSSSHTAGQATRWNTEAAAGVDHDDRQFSTAKVEFP